MTIASSGSPVRVSLSAAEFERLVSGKIVTLPNNVEIALEDIGFARMAEIVDWWATGAKKS